MFKTHEYINRVIIILSNHYCVLSVYILLINVKYGFKMARKAHVMLKVGTVKGLLLLASCHETTDHLEKGLVFLISQDTALIV